MKKHILAAFWSPYPGQSGQTAAIASLGAYIGINYSVSTLLVQSRYSHLSLESAFLPQVKDAGSHLFDEKGIYAIEKLAKTKQLSGENFSDYTTTLIPERLEIMPGMSRDTGEPFSQVAGTLMYIIACARQAFDLVLYDVSSATSPAIADVILKKADVLVICLNQNLEVLRNYFSNSHTLPDVKGKKHLILLGNYDPASKCTTRYIKRLFRYGDELYPLPRNTGLLDACNDHDLLRFFYTNNLVTSKDDSFPVIESVKNLSTRILQEIQPDCELLKKPISKPSLFQIINIFSRKGE